jgi:hypothetical protein
VLGIKETLVLGIKETLLFFFNLIVPVALSLQRGSVPRGTVTKYTSVK